ncbi:MAG: deoxyhypusine synthase family protein [Nanoarchaeota archaeon]
MHLANAVNHVSIVKGMKASALVSQMAGSGVFGAGRIAKANDVMQHMLKDRQCTVFLGIAGAMVPGGMKNIIVDMLESGRVDVLVSTGANLTHDLVEALGHRHLKGESDADDKKLHDQHMVRMYDSLMPNKVYEELEDFFEKQYDALKNINTIKDFLWKLGSLVPNTKGNKSILRTCAERKIPLFCPAIADSGIGLMIWGHITRGREKDKCKVLAFEDMKEMMQLAWNAKRAGVIYVGGGVPKNYIQQAMQLAPKGAEYGVQITSDRPEPGGSSGASLKEGVSWGKMSPKGEFVDVYCDATIALPLLWAAVKDAL